MFDVGTMTIASKQAYYRSEPSPPSAHKTLPCREVTESSSSGKAPFGQLVSYGPSQNSMSQRKRLHGHSLRSQWDDYIQAYHCTSLAGPSALHSQNQTCSVLIWVSGLKCASGEDIFWPGHNSVYIICWLWVAQTNTRCQSRWLNASSVSDDVLKRMKNEMRDIQLL